MKESTGDRWIPLTKASDAEILCFLGVRMNKRWNYQRNCRRVETPWSPCDTTVMTISNLYFVLHSLSEHLRRYAWRFASVKNLGWEIRWFPKPIPYSRLKIAFPACKIVGVHSRALMSQVWSFRWGFLQSLVRTSLFFSCRAWRMVLTTIR